MHRNTYVFVVILAVFAALVTGINLGRKLGRTEIAQVIQPTPQSPLTPTPQVTPTSFTYRNEACGISLEYPSNMTVVAQASNSAIISGETSEEAVVITCQKEIPKPLLQPNRIETVMIGSTSATLYHDVSAKDGTPIDKIIFTHPKNRMDVLVAGIGAPFETIRTTLQIL